MNHIYLIILCLMIGFALPGQETAPFGLPAEALRADSASLFDFAGYYGDSTGRLELEDMRGRVERFGHPGAPDRAFSNRHQHWFYFRIDNRAGRDTFHRVLTTFAPYQTHTYQLDSRGLTTKKTGQVNRPFRDFIGYYNSCRLEILPGEEAEFFIRIDNRPWLFKIRSSHYELALTSTAFGRMLAQRQALEALNKNVFTASFLAILFFLALFTFSMYLQNREQVYLHYALYVAIIFLYYFMRRSSVFHTPFSYINEWRLYLEIPLGMLVFLVYLNFIRIFLDVDRVRSPRLFRVLNIAMKGLLVALAIDLLLVVLTPLHTRMLAMYYLQNALFLAGAWVVYRVYQQRSPLSKYIVVGSLALVAGGLLVVASDQIFSYTGIRLQYQSVSYAQLGILAETFIFALGLGYRGRVVREEKMAAELKALKAQMKPHFVFNSLNSIKDLIQKQHSDEAVDYLTKFARLMRGTLKYSERALVELEEELEMCEHYLQLESLRFDRQFHFEIDVTPGMEECMVPPMLFQPFLENAIWHGLLPKKDGERWVKLSVFRRGIFIVGRVEDNGVGRRATASDGGSFGIRLSQERIQRQLPYGLIQVSDKFDTFGQPEGTIVEVIMQLNP